LQSYPGATKLASQYARQMHFCGHSASIRSYRTKTPAATVTQWYAGRMPGAVRGPIRHVVTPGMQTITGSYLIVPDGSGGVVVEQLVLSGVLAQRAHETGGNGTMIALADYDPALSRAEMHLFAAAASSDAATRKHAKAQLKVKCGANGFSS
jgi:hypothetical protein